MKNTKHLKLKSLRDVLDTDISRSKIEFEMALPQLFLPGIRTRIEPKLLLPVWESLSERIMRALHGKRVRL